MLHSVLPNASHGVVQEHVLCAVSLYAPVDMCDEAPKPIICSSEARMRIRESLCERPGVRLRPGCGILKRTLQRGEHRARNALGGASYGIPRRNEGT